MNTCFQSIREHFLRLVPCVPNLLITEPNNVITKRQSSQIATTIVTIAIILAVVIATSGIVPAQGLAAIKVVQTFLLAAAMFGLGCGVKIVELRKVGVKPLVLDLAVSVVVAMVAYVGAILS